VNPPLTARRGRRALAPPPAAHASALRAIATAKPPTIASTWESVSGIPFSRELIDWPPDVLAFTEMMLERSQAYRFVLAPPGAVEWPPSRIPDWPVTVTDEGRAWCVWAGDSSQGLPHVLLDEWDFVCDSADTPLDLLGEGKAWRVCESLLTVHAIADEACAGLGIPLASSDGGSCLYRARGRELLARAGTLSRIHPQLMRVLPKVRASPNGTALGSLSRYACMHRPGATAKWHKIPIRHRGTDARASHANLLLLPWPLRVRETDFRPVDGPLRSQAGEPFGYFEFVPAEKLDLDLVSRVVLAARDEVESVDVVCLPESAVDEGEIPSLEAVLEDHGVSMLITGVRGQATGPGRFPRNWVHTSFSPRLAKGERLTKASSEPWFHVRQNKHHRWALDENQIFQYHLGGALHPQVRWWEAMDVPQRSLQFVELGEDIAIVSLVCEDLAQIDDVKELIRSVGPTAVVTPLLDGPQLTSRWAARYASVLADDPGVAVCTLSSFGMVQRSRPRGAEASRVFSLWKDPARGTREIALEPGAQGVVITTCAGRGTRGTVDGRNPVNNAIEWFDVAVHQVRATPAVPSEKVARPTSSSERVMDVEDLTVLTGWAQSLAEALALAPERVPVLLADARGGCCWRGALGIAEPSDRLLEAFEIMTGIVQTAAPRDGRATFETVLAAIEVGQHAQEGLDQLVRRVMRATLEQARTRQG
jgi:hypothetical protein